MDSIEPEAFKFEGVEVVAIAVGCGCGCCCKAKDEERSLWVCVLVEGNIFGKGVVL